MSTLQLFDFEGHQIDWGQDDQGNPVCEARQLGKILGFSPSYVPEVVSRIYPQFKFQSAMGKPGRPSWYLREPGIYQMIFESKSDIAQRFQCWVFEEVLPKLRTSGGYINPNATSDQLQGLQAEISSLQGRVKFLSKRIDSFAMVKRIARFNGDRHLVDLCRIMIDFMKAEGRRSLSLDDFERALAHRPEIKLPWKS
jgi:prophage antirepressor-like protein